MDLGKKSATEIERSLEIPWQVVGVETVGNLQGLEFPSDLQVSGDLWAGQKMQKCLLTNSVVPTAGGFKDFCYF